MGDEIIRGDNTLELCVHLGKFAIYLWEDNPQSAVCGHTNESGFTEDRMVGAIHRSLRCLVFIRRPFLDGRAI